MTMQQNFSYAAALQAAQRVNWKIEDIIGPDKTLDFSRRFMPESLARVEGLDFLSENEKLKLNQIRGHDYLYIFGFVEEFILPFVLDHVRPSLGSSDSRTRAMLQFASEEAKHIDLFKRFRGAFEAGFGQRCDVIGPPEAVAKAVLAEHPLGVALVILHIEWMTQRHYIESVRDDGDLDPQFKSLLRHHWMEEAQHAKLDTLMVREISATMDAAEIERGVAGYLNIGGMLDAGLKQQVAFDLDCLSRATGRTFDATETERFHVVQHQANRWTFLGTGMTHPNFLATVEQLSPAARRKLEEVAPAFC